MLLDDGICILLRQKDVSQPGDIPEYQMEPLADAWYGELEYASAPEYVTELREDVRVDRRIRILRDISLDGLHSVNIDGRQYKVNRAYHGTDEESGERIADLSLQRVLDDGST